MNERLETLNKIRAELTQGKYKVVARFAEEVILPKLVEEYKHTNNVLQIYVDRHTGTIKDLLDEGLLTELDKFFLSDKFFLKEAVAPVELEIEYDNTGYNSSDYIKVTTKLLTPGKI